MNRAAWASRFFFLVALVPTVVAASFAAYEFHVQEPPHYRADAFSPQVSNPGSGFLLGAYAPGQRQPRWKGRPTRHEVDATYYGLPGFENQISCAPTLSVRYINFGGSATFPVNYVASAADRGSETVIELLPKNTSLSGIGQGMYNHWLKNFAHGLMSLGDHVMISFAPEMNGGWYTYGGVKPSIYIRAYTVVHDVVNRAVHNKWTKLITWLWQPSAMHTRLARGGQKTAGNAPPLPYWPGEKNVDKIALDGYYYFPADTFKIIFGPTITMLSDLNVPIMIGEVAAGTKYGPKVQVAHIKNLFAGVKSYPVAGFIWYDKKQLTASYPPSQRVFHQDWRLRDDPAALAAFENGVHQLARPIASAVHPKRPSVC